MTPNVENAAILVDAVNAFADLAPDHGETLGIAHLRRGLPIHGRFHIAEYPRSAYGGTSHHHTVNAIARERFGCL